MSTVVGHRDDLRTVLELLRVGIELEGPCDYGDPADTAQPARKAVQAHFADLYNALEQWDREVERARLAPGALWVWLAEAAREMGITEPPYLLGTLVDLLAIGTADRSRDWLLDVPHELEFEHFTDRIDRVTQLSLYLDGRTIARLPAEDADRALTTACSLVQALFDEAQRSEPAQEIGAARDSLLARKEELLQRLVPEAMVLGIRFAGDCPVCAGQAGNGEPPPAATTEPG
jgi:hypothetical protein